MIIHNFPTLALVCPGMIIHKFPTLLALVGPGMIIHNFPTLLALVDPGMIMHKFPTLLALMDPGMIIHNFPTLLALVDPGMIMHKFPTLLALMDPGMIIHNFPTFLALVDPGMIMHKFPTLLALMDPGMIIHNFPTLLALVGPGMIMHGFPTLLGLNIFGNLVAVCMAFTTRQYSMCVFVFLVLFGLVRFIETQECGDRDLFGASGSFRYPLVSGTTYPNNANCEWVITVPNNGVIQLVFNSFALEYQLTCNFDVLEIYDGPSASSPLIGRFCGTTLPSDIRSTNDQLYFSFSSDSSVVSQGFEVTWTVENECGDSDLFGASGSFRYPLVSGTTYPNNANCEWVITVPNNGVIQLMFNSFDLEYQLTCNFDVLEIYDGPSASSPLIGRFCGTTLPSDIRSTNNQLYFSFSSDSSVVLEGFEVTWTDLAPCGQTMKTNFRYTTQGFLTNAHNRMDVLAYSALSIASHTNDWCLYDAFEKTMEAVKDYLAQLKLAGEEAKTFADQPTVEFVKKMTSRHEDILKQFSVYMDNSRRAERTESEAWLFNKLNEWLNFAEFVDDDRD
ncbi:unnamed protein product [Owenia fusiformis]|uniref:CUB domain-containing protein n=1 Tax=Owenia fusiformis TaxID=6347 RepID=A0A8S4P8R8_OWEFU|nr:unnamed protein product [Owenia fusiformis]